MVLKNIIKIYKKQLINIIKNAVKIKSKRHDVFTEKIHKPVLSTNDDKRMEPINSIETYAYGTSKYLIIEKKRLNASNVIKQYKK